MAKTKLSGFKITTIVYSFHGSGIQECLVVWRGSRSPMRLHSVCGWGVSHPEMLGVGRKSQFLTLWASPEAPECPCNMAAGFPPEKVIQARVLKMEDTVFYNILLLLLCWSHQRALLWEETEQGCRTRRVGISGSHLEDGLPQSSSEVWHQT